MFTKGYKLKTYYNKKAIKIALHKISRVEREKSSSSTGLLSFYDTKSVIPLP